MTTMFLVSHKFSNETTDSIFQRIESTICGGGFEKLGLLIIVLGKEKKCP
ncbi:hypothetical protein MTBBW1_120003 [Desulfamplus magnetovallimortis]|uniref:Uncharacterized protein n=1 Tax=Desulfamplus magnetovallimortis TaxID=1246637 RepID=A0A1W1H600_9BACT|nr:hypothetical protein MTBBW1_120003 [Desulfamplus magnetovallimortis]